jgi:heme exporter protein D
VWSCAFTLGLMGLAALVVLSLVERRLRPQRATNARL